MTNPVLQRLQGGIFTQIDAPTHFIGIRVVGMRSENPDDLIQGKPSGFHADALFPGGQLYFRLSSDRPKEITADVFPVLVEFIHFQHAF